MSFSPPPPPGFGPSSSSPQVGQYSIPYMNSPKANEFPRRPKIWVPPVIAFSAFTAGYAIPWEFGENASAVITRVVIPLSLVAILCLVAGYYSYRTLPGWRIWTFVSCGAMTLNAMHFSLIATIQTPVSVQVLLWLSVISLGLAGFIGLEAKGDIHQKPTMPPPGDAQ